MTSERIINIFEHIATSAPVFTPTAEDFDVPQLRPSARRLWPRQGRRCRLSPQALPTGLGAELRFFGGRQQLYERLHSGSPEVIISGAYQRYDKSKGIAMVNKLIGG